jgi:hypothetical protein
MVQRSYEQQLADAFPSIVIGYANGNNMGFICHVPGAFETHNDLAVWNICSAFFCRA